MATERKYIFQSVKAASKKKKKNVSQNKNAFKIPYLALLPTLLCSLSIFKEPILKYRDIDVAIDPFSQCC